MKKIVLAGILLISFLNSNACDICGCSSGNYFIGPFPQFHKHFFGTRYTFRSFNSPVASDETQFSKDLYQTVELWGGINIGKKWQVLGFVPYNFNRQRSDDGTTKNNGIGDITLIVNYRLLDKQSAGHKTSQQLWIGGGLKLPTGHFSPDPDDIIPTASNQSGTGSVDFLLNAMYTIHINNWGINSTMNYKINNDADGYRFGNRFSSTAFVFRSFSSAKTTFSPNAGVLYENLAANKLDNEKVPDSGGNALLAAAGLEMSFKKVAIGFNVQLPVAQNFYNEQTDTKVRGMLHLTFSL